LIVVSVATMAVYSFTDLMLAFDDSAYLSGDLVQARVNVESGASSIRLLLSEPPESRVDFGGVFNNPDLFQAITVSTGTGGDAPSNYSVIAPSLDEMGMYGGIRFGLQNESARLNVNTLIILEENSDAMMATVALTGGAEATADSIDTENIAVSLLMGLPGMTEDVADAILDYIDEDEETRPYGAESDYYTALATPYSVANGPLKSVEELLLVRGVTPSLLFGADINRNGVIDPDEQQRFGITIDTPGALGWAAYLTVHGAEANKRRDGAARVHVNQDDLELLYEELVDALGDESYASFIAAFRIAGQSGSAQAAGGQNGAVEWSADALGQLDLTGGGGTELTQILDLVGATVTIGDGNNQTVYRSPFEDNPIAMALYLPLIMDSLSTQDFDMMPGRINLNECPAELLYGIPLMTEEIVDAIIESREVESDDLNRQFETWPLVEGLLTTAEMRQLLPLLTGGGDVYRAQIIGYFENSGAAHRAEIIMDATTVNPKIISWRDLSHLGRGFDLSVLGMRSGAVSQTQ
jgi:hypothetical protein